MPRLHAIAPAFAGALFALASAHDACAQSAAVLRVEATGSVQRVALAPDLRVLDADATLSAAACTTPCTLRVTPGRYALVTASSDAPPVVTRVDVPSRGLLVRAITPSGLRVGLGVASTVASVATIGVGVSLLGAALAGALPPLCLDATRAACPQAPVRDVGPLVAAGLLMTPIGVAGALGGVALIILGARRAPYVSSPAARPTLVGVGAAPVAGGALVAATLRF